MREGGMAGKQKKRVAILVDNYFEEAEFTGPLQALRDAGVKVDIISTGTSTLHGMNHAEIADTFIADKSIDDVVIDDYDALVLPGGAMNADNLRMNDKAKLWLKNFMSKGKPVAAICHAPWILASTGLAKGRKLTSYFTIQDDMRNAGALWIDQEVVIDHNLITSRNPDDVPAFSSALTSMLQVA
jgi:protease I